MNKERKYTKEQIERALRDDLGSAHVFPHPNRRDLNLHPGDLDYEYGEKSKFAAQMFSAKLLDLVDQNPAFASLTAEFLHKGGDDLARTFVAYKRYMDGQGYRGCALESPAVESVLLRYAMEEPIPGESSPERDPSTDDLN